MLKARKLPYILATIVAPTLGALSLSATTFAAGTPSSGTINGATALSTITASGLPGGLTIDSASRTWTWDGTGTASTGSFTLTETLAGAVGSPLVSTISYTIAGSTPLGGNGTLSAPEIGYPSGGLLPVTIPNDWQSGPDGSPIDTLVIAKSASEDMSSPTFVRYDLKDTDTPGSTISVGLDMTGEGYIVAFGSHLGTDSQYLSNIVAWGNSAAPTITTLATQSHNELTQYAVAITADQPISTLPDAVRLTGGADQSQFEVYQDGSGNWFYRPYANGTFDADNPTSFGGTNAYSLQITGTSVFGTSSAINITDTIQHVSKTVTLTPSSFGTVAGATDGQVYPLPNRIVVSGLAPGISVPFNFSGSGFSYSKNGGSFVTAASGTATNGDTFDAEGETSGGAATFSITFTPGTSYAVTATGTVADNAVGLSTTNYFNINPSNKITLSNGTPPLTFSTNSGNSVHQIVSCDTAKPSGAIRQWELTVSSNPSPSQLAFGMASGAFGAVNYNQSPSPEPGRSGQPNGFFYGSGVNNFFTDYNGATAGSGSAGSADAYASGDVFTIIWDSIGHTIKVIRTRAGVARTMCTATGVTDTQMCPYVGADQNGVTGTVNFGASAFTYPLSNTPGAVGYNS